MTSANKSLNAQKRTMYCGEPRRENLGQRLVLKGWAHHRRDHGGVIFIDLRDRAGICQVVFKPDVLDAEKFAQAHTLRSEYVLAVEGELIPRTDETINPKMATGELELVVDRFEILNTSHPTPFKLDEFGNAGEEIRMRYRYLDLRRPEMQANIIARHRFYQTVRGCLSDQGFLEIETPCLAKATPEGARDFLVPSRMNPGKFYALPQSPQIFKQILMIAGYDKYFQMPRCFRDEDLRSHRTLEFTQIDIEMSFITQDDLFPIIEEMMQRVFKVVRNEDLPTPFPRMTYADAMLRYGSDKPDMRFDLPISDVSDCFAEGCDFKVFNSVLKSKGAIRAICLPGGGDRYSNTQLKPDGPLNNHVAIFGAKGLAWFRVDKDGALESSIAKFFTVDCQKSLIGRLGAKAGDLILMVADKEKIAAEAMGQLRLKVAADCGLIDESQFKFLWVTDFPLMDWNEPEKRWDPCHHPFTAPVEEDMDKLTGDEIGKVNAQAYDLALNGVEIGGGSIRIHRQDVQAKVFKAIGLSDEEAQEKFGFLLEALTYGAPPHGGIAFGVDRMLMLLLGMDSNREVIPFPTNQSGVDLMSGAPSTVSQAQMAEVFIDSTYVEEEETEH